MRNFFKEKQKPELKYNLISPIAIGIIFYIAMFFLPASFLVDLITYSMFALAFDIIFGYMGWVSLGHILYYGAGVYIFAIFTKYVNANPIVGLIVVLAGGGFLGLLFSPIFLRSGGIYFAFINLAFAAIAYWLVIDPLRAITGGADGMELIFTDIPFISFRNLRQYYVLLVVVFVLFLAVYKMFTRSSFCYLLKAIKENETKLKSCGYDTFRIKAFAFVLSTMFSAFAGALRCIPIGYVNPDFVSPTRIGDAPFACLIGGPGTFYGPIFGSLVITGLKDILVIYVAGRWEIVLGFLVILVTLWAPKGLYVAINELIRKVRRVAA